MTLVIFLFVFKKVPSNNVTPYNLLVHTTLVNERIDIFVCLRKDAKQLLCLIARLYVPHWSTTLLRFLFVFKKMPNNEMTSHSKIVRTALVNDPNDIFVCLQKDAKQCCDATQQDCTYYTGPLP